MRVHPTSIYCCSTVAVMHDERVILRGEVLGDRVMDMKRLLLSNYDHTNGKAPDPV